jgi:hypothetical protein
MIVGAFGPWAHVLGFISVSGTGAGDGWIVVAAAILGAIFLWLGQTGTGRRRLLLAVAILAGLAAAITSGYDLSELRKVANNGGPPREIFGTDIVDAGWGIYTDLFASCVFALATALAWFQLERRTVAADGLQGEPSARHGPSPHV